MKHEHLRLQALTEMTAQCIPEWLCFFSRVILVCRILRVLPVVLVQVRVPLGDTNHNNNWNKEFYSTWHIFYVCRRFSSGVLGVLYYYCSCCGLHHTPQVLIQTIRRKNLIDTLGPFKGYSINTNAVPVSNHSILYSPYSRALLEFWQ